MKLQRIELRNFRSFGMFDLDLNGRSVFVIGENGVGKTSLLTAVARALGRDLTFTSADFTTLDQPIELRVTLSVQQNAVFVLGLGPSTRRLPDRPPKGRPLSWRLSCGTPRPSRATVRAYPSSRCTWSSGSSLDLFNMWV